MSPSVPIAQPDDKTPWPKRLSPYHKIAVTLEYGNYYVDRDRKKSQDGHVHLYAEYGLVDHERCEKCGLCRKRRK